MRPRAIYRELEVLPAGTKTARSARGRSSSVVLRSRSHGGSPIARPIALPGRKPDLPGEDPQHMKAKPEGTAQHSGRGRIAAALCTAGVVAIALGGNLLGAGAEQAPPLPGEHVAAPPTQVAADSSSVSQTADAAATTQTTTAVEPTTTQTTTTPAADTTTTPPTSTEPAPATPQQAPATQPVAPAVPKSATPPPAAPVRALPFDGVAGPAGRDRKVLVDCVPASSAKRSRKAEAALEAADEAGSCERKRTARRTTAPQRGEQRDRAPQAALRNARGVPTVSNPTRSLALPGAVPVGVPNFFIDKF